MPLSVILGSVVAIAALVAINIWLHGWHRPRIPSIEVAVRRLRDDLIDFEATDIVMCSTGRTALARSIDQQWALVVAHGDGLVTRRLNQHTLAQARRDDAIMTLTINEPLARPIRLVCTSAVIAQQLCDPLEEIARAHAEGGGA